MCVRYQLCFSASKSEARSGIKYERDTCLVRFVFLSERNEMRTRGGRLFWVGDYCDHV